MAYYAWACGSRYGCKHMASALKALGRAGGIDLKIYVPEDVFLVRSVSPEKRVPKTVGGSTRRVTTAANSFDCCGDGSLMFS